MNTADLTLLVPEKADIERDAVAVEWAAAGGKVVRLDRFWEPPSLDPHAARLYGNDTFCFVLEQLLGLELVSPPDDLVFSVAPQFLKREVKRRTLSAMRGQTYPTFAKSLVPKQFRAAVFDSYDELLAECTDLLPETEVIHSDIYPFVAEARAFVRSGEILDCQIYEGASRISEAKAFADSITSTIAAPETYVLDVGFNPDGGWALVEFNASWGAGLNNCDAKRILPAIEAATRVPTT